MCIDPVFLEFDSYGVHKHKLLGGSYINGAKVVFSCNWE